MTIRTIIERVWKQGQGALPDSVCIRCLSELDESIYEDIVLRHAGAESYMRAQPDGSYAHRTFPYTADGQTLIAPRRFAKMYEWYLRMEADVQRDEPERYVNDLQLFEQAYRQFAAWYNETHTPIHAAAIQAAPQYVRSGAYATGIGGI
ncbi:MAG: hypothetical protein E7517_03335 [Ruminococcaceae bacterium]|nr:hypothetical protein [Oscillospiraceae bacterium]